MPAPRNAGRLAYVDGLRAVAVLLVILFHTRVHMPGTELGMFFKECSHGVDLFFVLSGLCLALPALERLNDANVSRFDTVAFAIKRCLRIFPPYVVALLLFSLAGSIALGRGVALPPGMSRTIYWPDVLSQVLFLDRGITLVNHSFWTLAIEFRWYLLFPIFLWLGALRPRALLVAIGLIILGALATRASSTDLGVLDAFLLGIVAAQVRVNNHPIARYGLLIAFVGAMFGLIIEQTNPFPIQTNPGWHIAAFGLVISAGCIPWLRSALSNRILVAIGVASYSIYLVHEPIISAIVIALSRTGPLLSGLAAIALALFAGFFMWALIERPITRPLFVRAVVASGRESVARLFERLHLPTNLELRRPLRIQASASADKDQVAVNAVA